MCIRDRSNISAVDIVKTAANKLGGKGGGGRPDFAQAGGSSMDGVTTAIVLSDR